MNAAKYIFMVITLMLIACISITAQNKSEAEFLKLQKEYKLNADGSYDMHCVKQVKLHTHMSFNSLYGETFIVYNPRYQKLTINECYTIQADGKRIDAPSNAFNEVLPSFAANAPYFNHLREMVVTHTGLELGATIYLDYTLHTKAGYADGIIVNDVLQESSPISVYTVSVEYPESMKLNANQYNCNKPSISEKGGLNKITWVVKNIPARSLESNQPVDGRETPRITFTTFTDNKFASLLNVQHSKVGSAIQNKVNELIKGETDIEKRTKSITSFVVSNISTVYIPLEYTGYKLRSIEEVFNTSYGTPLEKSVLLAAMLNSASINALPVITTPAWALQVKAVDNSVSNNGICLINNHDFPVMVGSTNNFKYVSPLKTETFIWNDGEKVCYAIKDNKFEQLASLMSSMSIDYAYAVNVKKENNEDAKFEVVKNGNCNVITNATTNNIINVASENDKEPKPIQTNKNGDYYTIYLPASYEGVDAWRMTMLSAEPRKMLLEMPSPISESYTYTCTLPSGMQFVNKDVNVNLNNAAGQLKISFETVGSVLKITRSIKLNNKIIKPADYMAFKALIDTWNTPNYRMVVVK